MPKRKLRLSLKAKLLSLGAGVVVAGIGVSIWYLSSKNFQVLNPAGQIARDERHLMMIASLLSLVVIIPVFILLFSFAWRYREGNTKKVTYQPNLDGSRILETIWWIIPGILIVALSVITWQSTHALDPYKPLASTQKPLKIQVVALQWKWLFLYPEQGVASVNFVQLPANTPIEFDITSDAPMNAFWIPQLGGQVYAMTGMTSKLHLNAEKNGEYQGRSANISGQGFSGMTFTARAGSKADFNNWVNNAKTSSISFDKAAYTQLALPSRDEPAASYNLVDDTLYDSVVHKYMSPSQASSSEPIYQEISQ